MSSRRAVCSPCSVFAFGRECLYCLELPPVSVFQAVALGKVRIHVVLCCSMSSTLTIAPPSHQHARPTPCLP